MEFKYSTRHFFYWLFILCGFYLAFEFVINSYLMLSVDDFWFAHHTYKYKDALPYRDFMPYKTVLGYYILLIPLQLFAHVSQTLIYTKHFIACLNAGVWFFAAVWLTRFFSKSAVLISLTSLIIAENVLSYSTNIRVDMFAYWFGLFSILSLLEKRYWLAGVLLGLGFITSQKIIWYLFASNAAIGAYWVLFDRQWRNVRHPLQFNLAFLLPVFFYFVFWACWSSWHTVLQSVWAEAAAMYQLDWYNDARSLFWRLVVCCNPLLFLLWPLTLTSVLITYPEDSSYRSRVFICIFSFVILGCLIVYKQIFPYYMQATFPVFLILYSSFYTWLIGLFKNHQHNILYLGKNGTLVFLFGYVMIILLLTWYLTLPSAYLLILTLPTLLGLLVLHPKLLDGTKKIFTQLIALSLLFLGALYPGVLLLTKLVYSNNSYQHDNIAVAQALLTEDSDYIAGLDLFYKKNQPIAGLKHLMGPAVAFLYTPTPKLRQVMLPALDQDPDVTIDSVLAALQQSRVKFYVNNYRIDALPPAIKTFLANQYEHFWGSIYLYAPMMMAGLQKTSIKFSGIYKLESSQPIKLDGKTYLPDSSFYIERGEHSYIAEIVFRLKLIPDVPSYLIKPNQAKDEWVRMV